MNRYIGLVFLVLVGVAAAAEDPARDGLKCYVCMGRDSENCVSGESSCNGYCYKVVDGSHDLIAKGCTTGTDLPTNSELSDWSPQPPIELYWTKGENGRRDYVRGRSYFCTQPYCNAGTNLRSGFGVLTALLVFVAGAFLLRL